MMKPDSQRGGLNPSLARAFSVAECAMSLEKDSCLDSGTREPVNLSSWNCWFSGRSSSSWHVSAISAISALLIAEGTTQ